MLRDADVVVVGGGVVGLCVARALEERGREVTLLEKDELGAGCSTGNAGLVVPSHVVPLAAPGVVAQGLHWLLQSESPFRIKPRLDLQFWQWLWTFYWSCSEEHVRRSVPVLRELHLASRSLYEEWAENGADIGFRPSGLLMLHETGKGRQEERKKAETAREAGLDVSVLDRDRLEEVTPHLPASATGGVYYHQDAVLDPTRLVDRLGRQVEEEGTKIHREVEVTGFTRENGTIQSVRTTSGEVSAADVVLAAGAWSAPLGQELGLDVPVEPAKGYSVTLDVSERAPHVPFILAEKKVSVTPLDAQMRFAGTLELAGFDASIDERRLRPILETAAQYVSAVDPDVPEAMETWVGFRPCTPDGLPIIGPVPQYDNLVLATGHSMMGVSLAPITGQLVAQILQGEAPTVDPEPLHLSRFS